VNSFRIEPGATQGAADESDEALDQYAIELSTALLRKSKQEIEREGRDFVLVDILDRLSRTSYRSSFDVLPSAPSSTSSCRSTRFKLPLRKQ
jgi:hypothetical protein